MTKASFSAATDPLQIEIRRDGLLLRSIHIGPLFYIIPGKVNDSVVLYEYLSDPSRFGYRVSAVPPLVLVSHDSGIVASHFSYVLNGDSTTDSFYSGRQYPLVDYPWEMQHRPISVSWNRRSNCKTYFSPQGWEFRQTCSYPDGTRIQPITTFASGPHIHFGRIAPDVSCAETCVRSANARTPPAGYLCRCVSRS